MHDRMKEAGVQNMSAYIRKMALNGYVIIPEWPDLNYSNILYARLVIISISIRKQNELGKLYEEGYCEEIKKMNNEQQSFKKVL